MVTGDDGLPDRLSQVVLRVAQRLVALKVEVHQNHAKSPIAQLRQQFPVAQDPLAGQPRIDEEVGYREVEARSDEVAGEQLKARVWGGKCCRR